MQNLLQSIFGTPSDFSQLGNQQNAWGQFQQSPQQLMNAYPSLGYTPSLPKIRWSDLDVNAKSYREYTEFSGRFVVWGDL